MPISKEFILSSNYPDVISPVQTLPDFALEEFERYGDETAFIFTPTGRRYTYAEIIRTVKHLSKGLKKQYNLSKGDIVGTVVSNCPEFLFILLAVQRLGATLTTANPAYTDEELEKQFRPANVKLILTENELLGKVEQVAKRLPTFRDIIHVRDSHSGRFVTVQNLIEIGQNSREIEILPINFLILPPPIQVFLAKSPLVPQFDLSSLGTIVAGAAPVSKDIAEEIFQRLPNVKDIVQIYGMTETSPLTHLSPLTPQSRHKLASIGTLVPSTKCKIVDPANGKVCGPMQPGELWIQGPQNMKGYLHNEEATRNMITPDGWLKTGDIGYFDSDEYFYISDRLKELIKVKGFQVPPAELEALILTHPSVAEVIVVGVPDPYAGELPRAYVVLKSNESATEVEIQDHVAAHVASYKRLSGGVRFVKEVPKTGSGKLLRRELRDKAREEFLSQKSKL